MDKKEAEELLNPMLKNRPATMNKDKKEAGDLLNKIVHEKLSTNGFLIIIAIIFSIVALFLSGEIGQLLGIFILLSPILIIAFLLWLLNYLTDKEKFKRDSKRVFDVWLSLIALWLVIKLLFYPMYKLIFT